MSRPLLTLSLALLLAAGCAAPSGSPIELTDGSAARRWGDGPYGLVLVHDAQRDAASWEPQARTFAEHGMTVVAVEAIDRHAVAAAVRALQAEGVERVAVLGAGAGAAAVISLAEAEPQLSDQLILLSASGDVSGLGVEPKLFAASEGEELAAEARRMADEAAGDWNAVFLAPGEASGQAIFSGEGAEETLEAVLRRLEERR